MNVAIGVGSALNGKQAVTYAIHYAFNEMKQRNISFALIISSQDFVVQDVISTAISHLGNVPIFGFSSSHIMTPQTEMIKTVVVALFSGEELSARTNWWAGFGDNSRKTASRMLSGLNNFEKEAGVLLTAADGILGDAAILAEILNELDLPIAGWLASGRLLSKETWQIGGGSAGSGGLASLELSGVKIGMGLAHGWENSGAALRITLTRGAWIRSIDGAPPSETYARLFGHQAVDWTTAPLNGLVRLYPFSIRSALPDQAIIRTPLWIEADGSLRMNTQIMDGSTADLMVGSAAGCLDALDRAVDQALEQLGENPPVFGMLLADLGWNMLLKTHSINLAARVQKKIGEDVPVLGAYTYGQLGRTKPDQPVKYLNQHVQVILFSPEQV